MHPLALRLARALLLFWLVLTLTFALVRAAPGDAALLLVAPTATGDEIARTRTSLGLDAPLAVQYARWGGSVLKGDLGTSFVTRRPVAVTLRETLPISLWLGGISLLVSFLVGVALGVVQAVRRGRTLDHVFAILDEAQNATPMQLKMFLTRMGKSSKFFITGDITQVDLPRNQASGLIQSVSLLKDIPGIDFIMLDTRDVVRHKLVTSIINAYEKHDQDKTQNETRNKWQQGDKAMGQYGE